MAEVCRCNSQFNWYPVLGIGLLVGLFFLVLSRPAQAVAGGPALVGSYTNKEEWDLKLNEDGIPIKVIVTRKAERA